MAFVGDDEVEGVDGQDGKFFRVGVVAFDASAPFGAAAKQIDGGALDG